MPADDRRPGGGGPRRDGGRSFGNGGGRFGDKRPSSGHGNNGGSRFDREPRRSFGDSDASRGEGRPASPWAGRSEARTEGRFEGRRDFAEKRTGEFSERPRHPEHRTEFPHVAKRSSTHHTSGKRLRRRPQRRHRRQAPRRPHLQPRPLIGSARRSQDASGVHQCKRPRLPGGVAFCGPGVSVTPPLAHTPFRTTDSPHRTYQTQSGRKRGASPPSAPTAGHTDHVSGGFHLTASEAASPADSWPRRPPSALSAPTALSQRPFGMTEMPDRKLRQPCGAKPAHRQRPGLPASACQARGPG